MNVFEIQNAVYLIVFFVGLSVAIFAFVNSLLYSAESYDAANKLTKTAWCTILGLGVVIYFVPVPIPLVNIILLVAALVYLADVRPALAGLRRR
ncbi:DUF2516 family protein [Nocardioides sp. 1609]|uniref:DUF2516 family protein n=1 Tax=Nocardioides sp. 1609 TaxID=2508327 RepID=UPI0010701672|nr:DUF2516 family protein [Nocardioides sp. 1609]